MHYTTVQSAVLQLHVVRPAVQGHTRSMILVRNESAYATSY